jgi:hypothetical protein
MQNRVGGGFSCPQGMRGDFCCVRATAKGDVTSPCTRRQECRKITLGRSDGGSIGARTRKGLKMESEHEFTLIIDGISELAPSIVDALFEAGCDDATISRQGELVSIDFDRVAPTRADAVLSAIQDVRKANIGARVLRVEDCEQGHYLTEAEAAKEAKVTAAINGALSLAVVSQMDPQLYRNISVLLMPAHSS